MECVAVIAVAVAVIFARLALMQELNPILWGGLAIAIYAGAPVLMIARGASWIDAPLVWLSSYGGLFLLFVTQCVVAERKRYRNRGNTSIRQAARPKKRRSTGQ
ncbi:MAG: hypothetical protein U0794_08960 [Isosphaeraceae bacterium]